MADRAELRARANAYALAARLLAREIDTAFYRRLRASSMELIDAGTEQGSNAAAVEMLAVEYCRLFVGPTPVCSPYASIRAGEAMLGSRSQHRVQAFLREHGLDVALDGDVAMLALDHAAVPLALLAHLHRAAAAGSDAAWTASRDLVERGLAAPVAAVARDVSAQARLDPYRTVGGRVAVLVEEEPAVVRY